MASRRGEKSGLDYATAGVDTARAEEGLSRLRSWIEKTFPLHPHARPELPIGYFANVVSIAGLGVGVAVSTDGVGTKLLVAQAVGRYDTVGIDCVAMNVNDLLCVGATPISLVDYIAAEELDLRVMEEIGQGLYRGAEQASISICGGEIAHIAGMLRGARQKSGLDLVGTAIGTVPLDRIIIGQDLQEGDAVIGLSSQGIHSNGFTLARRALFQRGKLTVDSYVQELGRAVGEELLEPTRIYVAAVQEMRRRGICLKALMHITGDGFFNLTRVRNPVGYIIDFLPPPPPIFTLIQHSGKIADEEMFRVFNMGVGFCVAVEERDASSVIEAARKTGGEAWLLGRCVADPERKIVLRPKKLVGQHKRFSSL